MSVQEQMTTSENLERESGYGWGENYEPQRKQMMEQKRIVKAPSFKMTTKHIYLNSTGKLKGKTGKCYIGEIFYKRLNIKKK